MKVLFIGANRRKGVSEKTGRPYDIAEVVYGVPDEHGEKRDLDNNVVWVYEGYGLKIRTVDLSPSSVGIFNKIAPFTEVTLQLEPRPNNPERNQVVGVS